jgi:hypothetical protein
MHITQEGLNGCDSFQGMLQVKQNEKYIAKYQTHKLFAKQRLTSSAANDQIAYAKPVVKRLGLVESSSFAIPSKTKT